MAAHSQIDILAPRQAKWGAEFNTFPVANVQGKLIDGWGDTEAFIPGNIYQSLGDNRSATGSITLSTEKSVCESCSGVIAQFKDRYPGINVNVMDNDGGVMRPRAK